MNVLKISWKNILYRPLSSGLSLLLLASGITIILITLLTYHQINEKFKNNAGGIDLVIAAEGSRLQNLEVMTKGSDSWAPFDMDAKYKVATNNYIAGGKDGYVTFGTVMKEGRVVDTYLDYAQSFVDYVKAVGTIDKLPMDEYSTQAFINKDGKTQ